MFLIFDKNNLSIFFIAIMINTIRVERAKKRITQAQLAEIVKVSIVTIHAVENNKFVPSVFIAFKIARHFKTRVEDIFQLEETD